MARVEVERVTHLSLTRAETIALLAVLEGPLAEMTDEKMALVAGISAALSQAAKR